MDYAQDDNPYLQFHQDDAPSSPDDNPYLQFHQDDGDNPYLQFHQEQQAEGPVMSAVRKGAKALLPGAAGGAVASAIIGGAGAGAVEGSVVPGWGTLAGAIGGGLAAGYAVSKAQKVALDAAGADDSTQEALNEEAHPIASSVGEALGNVATMRPAAAPALVRAGSAALTGGLSAIQDYLSTGEVSPTDVAINAATGAVFTSPNRIGQRLEATASRLGRKVAGRPNVEPNPAVAPAQDEAQSSQQRVDVGEASFVQPPPSIEGDTVGNPQSQPTRSDRVYPKGQTQTQVTPDILTSGDFPPDVAQALQENLNQNRVDTAERGTLPGPENPNDIDQSLKSAPVETGFPQAATTELVAPRAPEPEAAPRPQPVAQAPQPEAPVPEAAPRAQPEQVEQVHPEAKKVADVREDVEQPTAAQVDAVPERLFGRTFNVQTPKGEVHKYPAGHETVMPYTRGELEGTKGADGERIDANYVGTGDRHFVIDQKDPETGKFDEHKVMAYAKDPLDALDHYYRGFNDGSGESRVLSIKEASADELKSWLAKPGKKKAPYDETASATGEGAGGRPTEPPLKAGHTRLYRGETDIPGEFAGREPLPDWLTENPEVKATANASGRWFVKDRATAEYYNQTFGDKKGRVSYVDVPTAEVENYLSGKNPEAKKFSAAGRENEEYFVPKEVAQARKPLGEGAQSTALVPEGRPKTITATVNQMRELGRPQSEIDAYLALPVGEQLQGAARVLRGKTSGEYARPDRMPTKRDYVEGILTDEGKPVQARSKADAARKSADVKVMNDAYEAFKPEVTLPKSDDEKASLRDEVQKFMDATKTVKYKPALKHEPYLLQRAAKKLLAAKNPSDASWQKFAETLHQLKNGGVADVRQGDRIESDIGLSRRSGDTALTNAEAALAPHNDVADAVIANVSLERAGATVKELDQYFHGAIDREALSEKTLRALQDMPSDVRKAAFDAAEEGGAPENSAKVRNWLESHFGEFDVPHEEAEGMVPREPVRTADDVRKLESATEHVDLTKPEGVAKLKAQTAQLADNIVKTADRKSVDYGEQFGPQKFRKIDVGGVDREALKAALERANAKNKKENPGNVRDEELGRFDHEPPDEETLIDRLSKEADRFLQDNGGALNLKKIHQDYMSTARPQLRQFVKALKGVVGLRIRPAEFRIDARAAQVISHRERAMARKAELLDGKYAQWASLPDKHQMDFQEALEAHAGKGTINPTLFEHEMRQMGVPAKDAVWMAQDADMWRDLHNQIYLDDKAHGSEEGYVRNYVAHIFEDDRAADYILTRLQALGPRWYQKERVFDSIKAARKAGFKLKYSNPIDVLNARLNASITSNAIVDMARGFEHDGHASPMKEASDYQKRNWTKTDPLPDGQIWLLSPDAVPFWKNAIADKGLQGNEGPLGSIYRNWMRIKRFVMPIQLGLSLFHFGHILSINATENLDRAFSNWRAGDAFTKSYGEAFRNMGRDLFSFPFDKLKWAGDTSLGQRSRNYEGRQIMKNWAKPDDQLSGWDKALGQMFEEAGTSPYQPHEDVIGAKRAFIDALNNWKKNPTGVGANLRMIEPSIARGVEKSQEWLFKDYIPGLKTAALARRMVDAVRHDPTLATNDVKRRQVFRELARSNDDRFGEMFYKGLFWDRTLKDAALGSFVSLGWNLGQWRQVGGAATQGSRALLRKFNGDTRGPVEKARQEASNKISFVAHYAGLTMLAAGGLSWALSGKLPTGLDYIFPRNGESNDDGTPGRLATPFNTREPVMIKAHIDERNSIAGGLAQMMWNKTVLQPVAELLSNKDFYGDHLWDTNAGPVKALLQGADAMLGRLFNPIAITGGTRAYQEGGGKKGMALALGGFGPAPKYAEESPLDRRITHLFREQALPEAKPYEYGPKTGLGHGAVQSTIRLAAGDKTTSEARNVYRKQMEHARATGDVAGANEAARKMATEGHVSGRTINAEAKGDVYSYRFSRLPEATQMALARQMSDADFQHYVVRNPAPGIKRQTKQMLIHERSSNQ